MSELCSNNKNIPLKFSVYSYINSGEHELYGSVLCSFKEIEKADPKILKLKNKSGGAAGFLRFNHLKMDVRPSLVEYLRHGWKMDVSIAIDFSLSNLEINDYRSLHKLSELEMNHY